MQPHRLRDTVKQVSGRHGSFRLKRRRQIAGASVKRRTGLKKQILLLGYAYPYHYEELICNDIQLTVFREDSIEELA